jgi:hypothetical protein
MDTIQIVLIIGIAVIILGAVVVGGKTLWETVNQKSTDLIGGG